MSLTNENNKVSIPYTEEKKGLYIAVQAIQEEPIKMMDTLATVSEAYYIYADGHQQEKEEVGYTMQILRALISNIDAIKLEARND